MDIFSSSFPFSFPLVSSSEVLQLLRRDSDGYLPGLLLSLLDRDSGPEVCIRPCWDSLLLSRRQFLKWLYEKTSDTQFNCNVVHVLMNPYTLVLYHNSYYPSNVLNCMIMEHMTEIPRSGLKFHIYKFLITTLKFSCHIYLDLPP